MQQQFNHYFQDQKDPLQGYYTCEDSQFYKLQVKNSNIFQSGKGLFAKEQFKKGEIILEYYGAIIKSQFCNDPPFQMQDKMVYINSNYCVISRGPASRANDIVLWQPQNYHSYEYKMLKKKRQFKIHPGKHRNAMISLLEKDKAFLVATQVIQKGQQIFIDYGFQYWDFFYKKAVKEQEKKQTKSEVQDDQNLKIDEQLKHVK